MANTFIVLWMGIDEVFSWVEWRGWWLFFNSMWFCDRHFISQRCISSQWPFSHSMVGFLTGSGVLCLQAKWTAYFSCTIPWFEDKSRPSVGGTGVSATYNDVCSPSGRSWPLGFHSVVVSRALSWGMVSSLQAVRWVFGQFWPNTCYLYWCNLERIWWKHTEAWHCH